MHVARFAVALALLFALAATASATLVQGNDPGVSGATQDGLNLTIDTTNNLAWLDVTLTQSLSFNTVQSRLADPGDQLFGYRYATTKELLSLFQSAGISPVPDPPRTQFASVTGSTEVANLISLMESLGVTISTNDGLRSSEGFFDDSAEGNDSARVGFGGVTDLPSPASDFVRAAPDVFTLTEVDPDRGSFLVQAIPEASSFLTFSLIAGGLAGRGGRRSRED